MTFLVIQLVSCDSVKDPAETTDPEKSGSNDFFITDWLTFKSGEKIENPDRHPYYAFYNIRSANPMQSYENSDAAKEKSITVSGKECKLKYVRTVVNDEYIADEYSWIENSDVLVRYYAGTDMIADIFSETNDPAKLPENFTVKKLLLDGWFSCDGMEYSKETSVTEYAERAADMLGIDTDGLEISHMSLLSGSVCGDTEDEYGFTVPTIEPRTTESGIAERHVIFSKKYSNGIEATLLEVVFANDEDDGIGLRRIRYYPQLPDNAFEISDDKIAELFEESGNAEDEITYTVVRKRYVMVCSNVFALELQCLTDGSSDGYLSRRIIFPPNTVFPDMPEL